MSCPARHQSARHSRAEEQKRKERRIEPWQPCAHHTTVCARGSVRSGARLPATTVLPAVAMSATMAMATAVAVTPSWMNDDGNGLNDDRRRPDDDGGWMNDDRRSGTNHDGRGVVNDRWRWGHHDGLRRRHPASLIEHPLPTFLGPARLDPDMMRMRRIPPVTSHPDVTIAAPLPVAWNPDMLGRWHGRTDFDLWGRRCDDDANHLGAGGGRQQKQSGGQKECAHAHHRSANRDGLGDLRHLLWASWRTRMKKRYMDGDDPRLPVRNHTGRVPLPRTVISPRDSNRYRSDKSSTTRWETWMRSTTP